jgi:hypothetical protein
LFALGDQMVLQIKGLLVGDQAQVLYV